MKKYIITIISVLLCCTPVHAKVQSFDCTGKVQDKCYKTKGCVWQDGKCDLCPAGKYGEDGECYACNKPNDAIFYNDDAKYTGMTDPYECPWHITCKANQHIDTAKWKAEPTEPSTITCEACPRGYHKSSNTRQLWNVTGDKEFITEKQVGTNSDGSARFDVDTGNTTGCSEKEFYIYISVQYVENCTTNKLTKVETQFQIPFSGQINYSAFTGATDNKPKPGYNYPSLIGTTFTLTPRNPNLQPENAKIPYMTLTKSNEGDVVLKASDEIKDWDHAAGFDLVITLEPEDKIDLYYCPFYPKDPSLPEDTPITAICNKEIYDRCNPSAKKISDITEYGTGMEYEGIKYNTPGTCDSLYATQWEYYTTPPSGRDNNPTLINIGATIPEPSESKEIYLIPHYEPCQDGTYNGGRNYCPDKCTPCLAGETSATDHTSCTPCAAGTYNNISGGTCKTCAGGYFSTAGATKCTRCPAGTYIDAPGDTCKPCADGYFSNAGATKCTQCPAGFTPDTNAKSWNDCYMISGLEFSDIENSGKTLLPTFLKVYYRGNSE